MKHIFRSILILLASIVVVVLGYYAYVLTTDTLSLPFVGQERQYGNTLQFVVAKPRFLIAGYDKNIIDQDALINALTLDGKPFDPTISGEGRIIVSGEYVRIDTDKLTASSILKIDASVYNSSKTTQYRLPRNMILTESKNPKEFTIFPLHEQRDKIYKVRLIGYNDLSARDIRWYMHTDASKNCDIGDVWDSLRLTQIFATELQSETNGQMKTAEMLLDFDPNTPRLCIIAGIGGDFYTVENRFLDSFSATGEVIDSLSPEYDMQSRIDFEFSSDLFVDRGDLYSREYISYRKDQKTLFLKNLDVRPHISLTEDNLILTPSRVSIVAPFEEGKNYKISLRNITDIYGRTTSLDMEFTPLRTPFLSLGLKGRKTMFRYGESIDTKLYALKTPKQEYPLMLCQISLEGYSRAERIIAENDKKNTDDVYDLLSSKEISGCIKKNIVIPGEQTISPFDIKDFSPSGTIKPGLYILAFASKSDVTAFDRFITPRVFSVVDTHIVLKVDASGKTQVLATDMTTGIPRESQTITLMQNIHKSYNEKWNSSTQSYEREYLPLTSRFFSDEIFAGKTGSSGILSFKKENLVENDYNTLYSLSHESYWDFEGRYSSFLLTASGGGHFGYVVSTWNDGITGWNFGLKDSQYSWETRPDFSAYLHTDRRLYLPGDKVFIHAIVRKNDARLSIPENTPFQLRVTDPLGNLFLDQVIRTNDYGSLGTGFVLPQDARLGNYSVNLEPLENTGGYYMMMNNWTNFQVEIFKNPTFTAEVNLRSPDIEDETLINLREVPNNDALYPWYEHKYESTFSIEGIVKAKYYNGQEIRNLPFTYRIYRNEYYDNSYWNDCFWGCFWQPSPEFYTEGTGSIDSDGFGFFRVPVEFSSYYSDYIYTAEVIIRDPMTGEEVVTPSTLLSRIPEKYKLFSLDNPLTFLPEKRIVTKGEKIQGILDPTYGNWNGSLAGKYQYELISRTYTQVPVDDLRLSDITISSYEEMIIQSGTLMNSGLVIDTNGLKSGEYHVKITPIVPKEVSVPEYATTDITLYIVGDYTTKNHNIQVIPEKTVYHIGETARVLITFPFTSGHVYITKEKGGIIESEYLPIEGNTLIREYKIDERSAPNMYIGAVALPGEYATGSKSYAVGYAEIITDLSDKKGNIDIKTSKSTYMNGEMVDVGLTLTDKKGNPLEGEVTMMVVDESLIRLLGNIDLDIIPKFFHKFPFTMKTSLTAIGMERNRFLSRKGSNGGSGDKGGGGVEIASRSIFQNTAYYNASIRTDKTGRAKISFKLPDNITDYRIITIAQTKNSIFAVSEKTIPVRRDYTLETHVPMMAYPGDTMNITSSAFNSTKKITKATIILTVGTGSNTHQEQKEVIMNPNESQSVSFEVLVREIWKGKLPYKITLIEGENILDSISKNIEILSIPLIESTERKFGVFGSGKKLTLELSDLGSMSLLKSRVVVRVSSTLLVSMEGAIRSLLQYPYGCIEQTIASTLPNAFALKFASLISSTLDTETAKKNLDEGVKKILRMQQFGGWKYWESDSEIHPHVTPYVVRSLLLLKELSVQIPNASLESGIKYIEDMVDYRKDLYQNDPDFSAEIFWTLAKAGSNHAKILQRSIDESKLSRHGYLAFAYGLQYLSGNTIGVDKKLASFMMNEKKDTDAYWYWSYGADRALYVQLLLERGEIEKATTILDGALRGTDLSSYFVSTQEKIQLLTALLRHSLLTATKLGNEQIALRGEALIADLSLTKDRLTQKVEAPRGKMGDSVTLTRSSDRTPLYYEILEYNIPDDIYVTPVRNSGGMEVLREFEKIDESRGIARNGEYLSSTPVEDMIFEKGQLYRVNIRVTIPNENATWQHLSVEDFMPGAWRPIRSLFRTESISHINSGDDGNYNYDNYWSYSESKLDRLLATVESGYGTTRTYSYYFRPEHVGNYLLPPVTAYFMYKPEIHAVGKFERITVK